MYKRPPLRHQAHKVRYAFDMTIDVDWVCVASQAKMLNRVKTRQRVCLTQILCIHQIGLTKCYVFVFGFWQGADVNNFDLTIGGHMCNKTIDARGDINMALWIVIVDEPSDQQVLVEIMAPHGSGSVGVI